MGLRHDWSDRLSIGGAFAFIDLGDAKIDNPSALEGEYKTNYAFVGALNFNYKF